MTDFKAFAEGDPEAFGRIYESYRSLVWDVALAYTNGDIDAAADLHQDIWILVIEKRSAFNGAGSFEGWLHRLATNWCKSVRRTEQHRSVVRRRIDRQTDVLNPHGATPRDPLAYTEGKERSDALHRALAELPPKQFETVLLRGVAGLGSSETARIMGLSEATVRSNWRHAMERLHRMMEDPDDQLSRHRSTS